MGWPDTEIGSKSSIHIREVSEGEDATLRLTAKEGVLQALTLLTDINAIDGATLYDPIAICVDKATNPEQPTYYLALEPVDETSAQEGQALIPAGTPFLMIPDEEEVVFYLGTQLAKEVTPNGVLNGLLKAKPLATDEAYIAYDTNELTNYLQVVGGNIKYNAPAYTAYLSATAFADLPLSENTSDFDLLIPMRNAENLTGIMDIMPSTFNSELSILNSQNAIYDLSGRRIVKSKSSNHKLAKGLYIVNGHKVVYK